MSFESSLWQLLEFLVLIHPLCLHLGLEVLGDLKVIYGLHESSLDKNLINVLEMNSVDLALICLNLVGGQNVEDVLVFDEDPSLLVDVVALLVVDQVLGLFEILL